MNAKDAARHGLRFGPDVGRPSPLTDARSVAHRYDVPAVLRPRTSSILDASGQAMDSAPGGCADVTDFLARTGGMIGHPQFIGYASCANLAQDGLMRAGVETLANELIREWGEISCADPDRRQALTDAVRDYRLRRLFRDAAANAGYFGVCRLFVDTGVRDPVELRSELHLNRDAFRPGGLRGFVPLDPILMAPVRYNASDPLSPWYYRPDMWSVMGIEIHASRFLEFVQNEPPFVLRPAYNFGGIPAVQIALDYLVHFTETREAAARLLKKFSLTAFKSNMTGVLYGDEESDIVKRINYFAKTRDNDGILMIDKDDEDLLQLNTPLSGVDTIVRQALEMLAAIWRMPVTKFLGISPGGMNATGESDMRNWYDYAQGQQLKLFAEPMDRALRVIQLSLFGDVDPACAWTWNPLWTASDSEIAAINKSNADTDAVLLASGEISQEEARARLAADPHSGYAGIDPGRVPVPPAAPGVEEVWA